MTQRLRKEKIDQTSNEEWSGLRSAETRLRLDMGRVGPRSTKPKLKLITGLLQDSCKVF